MLGLPPNPQPRPQAGRTQSGLPFLRGLRGQQRYIDLNKDTQFSDAWVLLAVLLLGFGLIIANRFFTSAGILLLTLAGVGWLWSAFSLYGLHYRRHFAEVRGFQGEEIGLTLEVQNRKFLPLTWLTVQDIFPTELPMRETAISFNAATNQGELRTFWMPNAFQRISRHFTIRCAARGFHKYGPAQVETGDGFGFFNRAARFPDEQFLIVYPRIYSVAEMALPAKNPFGALRAHGHLHEDPLRTVGVRAWASGDSPRRIHWKATARHQELLSRVYEPSKEQQILIFLNVATLERHWLGTVPELQERTISVAASLACVAAEQRLPVGLIANGTLPGSDQPLRLLPGRNPQQLTRILELLAAVTPFASDPIEQLLLKEAPRLNWGTTIVVVTAIAHEALLAALLELAAAGRLVVLCTLAEQPPTQYLRGVTVYHLPHLIDDLILPQLL
ncbi:MAG: DUF58 domain-containing protein [Chloroflexi bacterium]|nr:MAG: DUF58 domain-containing protein [Chloroflexota bacterium]